MPAASINNIIGKRFIELLNIDSTNNYAMRQIQKGEARHGDAYFAFEQTAGKGRFNRQWLSARGENIILSIVLDTSALQLSQQFSLNMIAALSVLELFNKYTTEKNKIKWPNDIYCRDRKAAGILIESVIRGQKWQYAVAGFGVNINQTNFGSDLKNSASLKQLTGKSHDVVQLAKELCSLFEQNLTHLRPGNEGFILQAYNNQLYKRNETAQFKQDSAIFSGMVKNVDEIGRLVVEGDKKFIFESGSVEWVH